MRNLHLKLFILCFFAAVIIMYIPVNAGKIEQGLGEGAVTVNQAQYANTVYRFDLGELINDFIINGYDDEQGCGIVQLLDDQLEFALNLSNGSYNVSVISSNKVPLTVKAEGRIRFHGTALSEEKIIENSFEVEVTDEQLNLVFCGTELDLTTIEISSILKFDFGNREAAPGYIKVPAATAYTSDLGYGFNTPAKIIDRASYHTNDPLYSDSVRFIEAGRFSTNSFDIDLVPGRYSFSFATGAIARESIIVNGLPAILNITGHFSREQFEMEIPDGKARITLIGKQGTPFELSALEVKKIADEITVLPRIWIGGDSTVCNYYPLEPENGHYNAGWGQVLHLYLTNDYVIRNYATGGQTTKGFREDGAFDAIVAQIMPGEYFILQLGINDRNKYPISDFRDNLEYFVDRIREKGGIPILVTPQGRSDGFKLDPWNNLTHGVSGWAGLYDMIRIVAREKNTLLIDNANLSSAYYVSIGEAETAKLYADATHPNYAGALQLARIITEDIKRQGISGIETTAQKTKYAEDGSLKFYTPELKNQQGLIEKPFYNTEQIIVSILAKNSGHESKILTLSAQIFDLNGSRVSESISTYQVDGLGSKALETLVNLPVNAHDHILKVFISNGDLYENKLIQSSVVIF